MTADRFYKNIAGDFYTTGECLSCDLPEREAPSCLAQHDVNNGDTYFIKQPETPEEVESICWAAYVCCNDAIRYGGTDPSIIRQMGNRPDYCDHLLLGGPIRTPMDEQREQQRLANACKKVGTSAAQRGVGPENPASVSLSCTTAIFSVNSGVMQWRAIAAACAACALWGFAFVGPVMLPGVSPTAIAAGRYLAYGLGSLLSLAITQRLRQPLAVWKDAATLSLLGNLLYFMALSAALHQAGVVMPTLIIGMLPVTIPLAACLLARRWPSPLQTLGLGLTLLGTWLARPQGALAHSSAALVGGALATFSLLVWTAYALINPVLLRRNTGLRAPDWSALQGVACLPFAAVLLLWAGPSSIQPVAQRYVLVSVVMGLVCSWFANSLWNWASQRLAPTVLGPLIVVEMLAGLFYGWLYTQQAWTTAVWAGVGLLLMGVVLAVRGEQRS